MTGRLEGRVIKLERQHGSSGGDPFMVWGRTEEEWQGTVDRLLAVGAIRPGERILGGVWLSPEPMPQNRRANATKLGDTELHVLIGLLDARCEAYGEAPDPLRASQLAAMTDNELAAVAFGRSAVGIS